MEGPGRAFSSKLMWILVPPTAKTGTVQEEPPPHPASPTLLCVSAPLGGLTTPVVGRHGVQVLLWELDPYPARPDPDPPTEGCWVGVIPGTTESQAREPPDGSHADPCRQPVLSPGQSGLGKSTLINTLFKSKISRKSVQQPTSEERIPKTIEIKSITHGERWPGPG